MYILKSKEKWPLCGSLNYYSILQLESFCHRNGKAGNSLHSRLSKSQLWVCSFSRTEPNCLETFVWEWKQNF